MMRVSQIILALLGSSLWYSNSPLASGLVRLSQQRRGSGRSLQKQPVDSEEYAGSREISYALTPAQAQTLRPAARAPQYTDMAHMDLRDEGMRKCVEWCGKNFYPPQLEGCEERCECKHLNFNATKEEKASKLRGSKAPLAGCGEEFVLDGGEKDMEKAVVEADSVQNSMPLYPGAGVLDPTDEAYSGGPLAVADQLGLKPLSEVSAELALAHARGQ